MHASISIHSSTPLHTAIPTCIVQTFYKHSKLTRRAERPTKGGADQWVNSKKNIELTMSMPSPESSFIRKRQLSLTGGVDTS